MKPILLTLTLICAALAAPAQSWTNRYIAPNNAFSIGTAITVDGNGNPILTGSVTIKYSNAGVPLWTNLFSGAALAVDGSNDVVVLGWGATIKYSSAGMPLWTNLSGVSPVAVAVDGSGNVFGAGYVEDAGNYDCATIKYSSAGLPLWTNYYNGSSNRDDLITAAAVDGNGDVIVVGRANVWDEFSDYLTIKYSSEGVLLWTRLYNGPANSSDAGGAVALDSSGNVFVTGLSSAEAGGQNADIVTIKYSSSGVPMWTRRYDGGGSGDSAGVLAVDGSGNVFVTGTSGDSGGVSFDYITLAYSNAGVPLWTNRYHSPVTRGYAIAAVGNGNVYVTGESRGSNDKVDYATIAYSSAGVPLWTNRYDGPSNGDDYAYALAVDASGNVFVTGASWNGTVFDCVTIKYAVSEPVASPPLGIQRLGNSVVLSWTNAAFGLQSAPNVTGTFTNVPGATSPYTNSISAGRQFFRLAR